jgi:mRNA-degrading endonuclease RelE of RelBE toxin-antitoxin system
VENSFSLARLDIPRAADHKCNQQKPEDFVGAGEPLLRDLTGLRKYKVRRFCLIYEIDREARLIRIFAIGHRREGYEELGERLREARRRKMG